MPIVKLQCVVLFCQAAGNSQADQMCAVVETTAVNANVHIHSRDCRRLVCEHGDAMIIKLA